MPNSKVHFANINTRSYKLVNAITQKKISDYDLRLNHKQVNYVLPVYGKFSVVSFIDLLGLDMSDVDSVATYISPLDGIVLKENYMQMEFSAKNTIQFLSGLQ